MAERRRFLGLAAANGPHPPAALAPAPADCLLPRLHEHSAAGAAAADLSSKHQVVNQKELCCSLQTQKKLEDIKAAAVAAGVPDLNLPVNSVVKGALGG